MDSVLTVSLPREKLKPAVGTKITGHGSVVRHDVTRCGLHRLCIMTINQYPDLETWCELLKDKDLKLHSYSERMVSNVFEGFLWLFWKEG